MCAEEAAKPAETDRVICGLPVDAKILFSDRKGIYRKRLEKSRTKLLQKLGFLGKFLAADEKIILVTTGASPFTAFEQLTMGGFWLLASKRALFVFTTKRLFHIPTTLQFGYRGTLAQILYQDCRQLRVKWGALVAEYHNGGKDKFLYIPSQDREMIKAFRLAADESCPPSENPKRNHLCPKCTAILPTDTAACPSCGLEFKNKAKAQKRSMLIPGGGYFYTNHPFMGAMDALVESYLTICMLVAFSATILGDPEALVPAILFTVILAVEKLITIHHSNSFLAEFIPCDLKRLLSDRPITAAPMEPAPPPPARTPCKARPEDILSVR